MKLKLLAIAAAVMFSQNTMAQLQTGENIAVTSTDAGKVRGYINNGIYNYKGIPYAEAKRFESPQKPKPWTGSLSFCKLLTNPAL